MAFDITDAKIKARRRVHKLAAAAATYLDDELDTPVDLTVRWHNKIISAETINSESEIVTGIERLVFSEEELALLDPPLELRRGGIVTIARYDNMMFELGFEEPNDGPVTTAWSVTALT